MKKLIMMLMLCCGLQAVAMAQHESKGAHRNMTPEQRAQKQTEKMQQDLQLSETQKVAVYELNLQTAKEMQAARAANKEAGKGQFKAMHDKKDAKLKSILDAGQYSKYQSQKAERMNKLKQKKGGDSGLREG